MYKGILKWLDHAQTMEIAKKHCVKSRRQVYNVIMGVSKNFALLDELTAKAEENKKLQDRAKQLENAA